MRKSFLIGLFVGCILSLLAAIGATYFIMGEMQETRAMLLLKEAHEHAKKGELDRAMAKLNQSIGAQPDQHIVHLALGEIYERRGDLVLAKEQYEITEGLCHGCYDLRTKIERLDRENKKGQENN